MFRALEGRARSLPGRTVLLVDVSGSMEAPISHRSEMRRTDAAYGVAILLREIGEKVTVYTFSNEAKLVAARRGMALRDALDQSQPHGGTYLGKAIAQVEADMRKGYDRMVVITDEQSHDYLGAGAARSRFTSSTLHPTAMVSDTARGCMSMAGARQWWNSLPRSLQARRQGFNWLNQPRGRGAGNALLRRERRMGNLRKQVSHS